MSKRISVPERKLSASWTAITRLVFVRVLLSTEFYHATGFQPRIFQHGTRKPSLVLPTRLSSSSDRQVDEQIDLEDSSVVGLLDPSSSNGLEVELQTEVSRSFLQYSLSIILGRALPDARDGLKPVHRRILYSMSQLNLLQSTPHRKCARVVGEVLGKLHPHGDQAVYDALVRMAQDFNTQYPLIDGHGNFGSIDADPAAAMRYTECRLTPLAQSSLLEDLRPAVVPHLPNFDGTEVEPTVLPAKLPLLLLNGSSGIAVGMATNIPPHNLKEIMTACMAFLDSRMDPENVQLTDAQLFRMVPAPDFPTGANILGTDGARKLYNTGNGGIVLRATTNLEKIVAGKQARTAIIVTELPYQTNKAALLERMADMVNDKKLDGIADLRDESDRDGIRVVIELKRDAVAAVVLNNLFKKTPLQTSFSGNFVALMNGKQGTSPSEISSLDATATSLVPQRFTLRAALDYWIDFRFETIRHRSRFELDKVEARAHIVEGLLIALEDIDAIINIIRKAQDTKSAKQALLAHMNGTEEQADAILKLQLGQLTRLNKGKLEKEQKDLNKSGKTLTKLLTEDNAVYTLMKQESEEMIKKFGTDRRSQIVLEDDGEVADIDLIRNSRSVVVVTRGGYIKRMPLVTFENQKRGTRGKRGTSDGGGSEDNEIAHCFTCNDHDTLLMVTQGGIAYGIRAFQVPVASRTAKGQPIPAVLPVQMSDVITTILPVSEFSENRFLVLATEKGWIKKTPLKAFEKLSSRGLIVASVEEDDRLRWCQMCDDNDDILVGSSRGNALRFAAAKLRPTGRGSRGVISMRLKEGDAIADLNILAGSFENEDAAADEKKFVLAVSSNGFGKRVATSEFLTKGRGGLGVAAIRFKKKEDDRMSCLRIVNDDDEILVITAKGVMVRQKVSQISAQGRQATGVVLQKLDKGDSVSSVSIVPTYEEQDDA